MKNPRLKLRALCEAAVFVAFAVVLSLIPVYRMPQGGSFDLTMLPLFIYSVRWGFGPAMLACTGFGVIQVFIEGGIAIGWQSIIGDFLVAYAVLGLSGLFMGRKNALIKGVVLGSCARFAVHLVVGATIWAEYMPPEFFGRTMTSPWLYSALYNGSYMLADMILCLALGVIINKPLGKYLRGEDLS